MNTLSKGQYLAMNSYYADTAYNSQRPRYQPSQINALGGIGLQRLPWGSTQELMPIGLIENTRKAVLKEEQRLALYQPNIPKEQWLYCNHEYIQPANISSISTLLEILYATGKMLAFPAIGVILISYLLILDLNRNQILYDICYVFPIIPGIFFYLWGIGAFLAKFFPQVFSIQGNGKIGWRINRRTGMVSKFTYKGNQVIEQTAPFDEFDGYLYTSLSRHGYLYEFQLFHRYEGWGLNFAHLGASKVDKYTVKNAWDFIQNYMDTSKALPEFPGFEIYRHLDPTTAQLDKQTGRNPRYWRDMSTKQWEEHEQYLGNSLRNNMDTRHCSFEKYGYVQYLSYCHWIPDPDYKYVD